MADIRNLRNISDKKRKEDHFFKTLRLQAKLAQQYSDAVSDKIESQQLNITPVAPQKRTVEEELNDYQFQRETAFKNLTSLSQQGMTPADAEKMVNELGDATNFNDLVLLNNQWKSIEDIAKKQKKLNAEFMRRIFNRYKETFGEEGIQRIPTEESITEAVVRAEEVPSATGLIADGSNLRRPEDDRFKKVEIGSNWKTKNMRNPYEAGQPLAGEPQANRRRQLWDEFAKYTKKNIVNWIAVNVPNDPNNYKDLFNMGNPQGNAQTRFFKLQGKDMVPKIINWMINKNLFIDQATLGYGMKKVAELPDHLFPDYENMDKRLYRKGHQTLMLPRAGNRRIVGKGIEQQPKPRYAEFGKYIIHLPSLNKGILNLKYTSYSNIANLPQQNISLDLVDFIQDMLENGKVNQSLFHKLSNQDQRLFVKLSEMAEIDAGLGYRTKYSDEEKEEMERFNLVKGIFIAGNNAPEVIQELRGFIRKFLNEGKISKSEGITLLQEISCIS